MSAKRKFQIVIDIIMILSLPVLMAYSLVGEAAHEWIGATILILFVVHHVLNIWWFKSFVKGKYTPVRVFGTVINLLLFADMFCLAVSGMVLSRYVFSFLPIEGGASFARSIHMLGSYWGLVLMSLHIGLHWAMVLGMIRKATVLLPSRRRKRTVQVCCLLVSAYGVYAFVSREIGDYMLLKTHFLFLDFDETLIHFLLDYFTIMVLFAAIGYYLQKLFIYKSQRKKKI